MKAPGTKSKAPAQWDLFISHASEDKEDFVKPLAAALAAFGVRVWYDEYSLRLGDSLSRSIDKGLANSNYGVVVLSPAFFAKTWPEYELRGLIARENAAGAAGKVILPIWHNVAKEDVLKFSPPLADKLAIRTDSLTSTKIAARIIEVIRPDIFRRILRRLAHLHMLREASVETINPARLKIAPIRHKELPPDLVPRVRLVRASLLSAYPHSMAFWLGGFQRDTHPSEEVAYWEHVAAVYQEYLGIAPKLLSRKERVAVYNFIFALQTNDKNVIAALKKRLPRGAAKVIKTLYDYTLPSYDLSEEFPAEGIHHAPESKAIPPDQYDMEHFPIDLPQDLIREILDESTPKSENKT